MKKESGLISIESFKVDFGLTFLVCIFTMLFNEIWSFLDKIPEAFRFGDIIYHIIAVITSILSNIAIGIAGAISYYYIFEFINKKKNRDMYGDLRANILFLFYNHIKALAKTKEFNDLNTRERRVQEFYDIYDIPILYKSFKRLNTEEQIVKFKKHLLDYFAAQSDKQIKTFTDSFQKYIDKMKETDNIRYFKGSKDLIDSVYISYEDDFSLVSHLYISEVDKLKRKQLLVELVKEYYIFLKDTIELYENVEKFIDCLDKYKVIVFIKMLD